eukprot:1144111-Pelagomonas_calceolata.AAC.3
MQSAPCSMQHCEEEIRKVHDPTHMQRLEQLGSGGGSGQCGVRKHRRLRTPDQAAHDLGLARLFCTCPLPLLLLLTLLMLLPAILSLLLTYPVQGPPAPLHVPLQVARRLRQPQLGQDCTCTASCRTNHASCRCRGGKVGMRCHAAQQRRAQHSRHHVLHM